MARKANVPVADPARKTVPLICIALVAAVCAIYAQAGSFPVIGIDDSTFTTDNFVVQAGLTWPGVHYAFISTEMGSWHPLTWLSHMLDYSLHGDDIGRHHWTSILLHAANSVLVFLLLRTMTGALWRSALVAALFAVHPMHVEPTVWLGDRKGVLAGLFWLGSTFAWSFYLRRAESRWKWYAAALVLFALGLMSKPVLVTLPFALILFEYWPLGRWREISEVGKALPDKIPFFALSIGAAVATYYGQKAEGAMSLFEHLPVATRIGNAIHSLGMYLLKTIWPLDLAFNYTLRDLSAAEIGIAAIAVLAIAGFAIHRWRTVPALAIGWLFFAGVLFPTLGLIQTGDQAFADRYSYIPHIGLFIALVWGGHALLKSEWLASAGLRVALGAVLAILAWLSFAQTSVWSSPVPFWEHTLAVVPNHTQGRQLLGHAYYLRKEYDRALDHVNQAIKLRPNDPDGYRKLAEVQFAQQKSAEALASLDIAVKLRPDSAVTQQNRGIVLREMNRPQEAIAAFEKALELGLQPAPRIDALFQIGRVRHGLSEYEAEVAAYRKALEIDPYHYLVRKNLAFAFLKLQRWTDAEREFSTLIQYKQDDEDVVRSLRFLKNRK